VAPESVKSRVLRRAAERVGSVEALAARLKVSPRQLQLWLENRPEAPDDVFLHAVDIVLGPEEPGG
jgi:hypothetical protein